jgi:hypothetical protein
MSRTKNLLTLNSSRINNSSGILHLENAEPSRRENRQFSPVESYTHVKVTGFWLFFTLVTNHHQKSTGTGNESFHGTHFAALLHLPPIFADALFAQSLARGFLVDASEDEMAFRESVIFVQVPLITGEQFT